MLQILHNFLVVPGLILLSYNLVSISNATKAKAEISIDYRPLKKSGVKIPINEYKRKDNKTLKFNINRKDISIKDYIWSWLWRKKFGFYMNGVNPRNKNKKCPYITDKEKLPGSKIEKIGDGKHLVTLVVPPHLIDAIIENRCAVSPKPRKAPDPGDRSDKKSKKPAAKLFPTVYD
jgi:hypothetical protein